MKRTILHGSEYMTRDKFKTARGQLTAYALACGYVQQRERGRVRVTLWHENGTLHVRAHEFGGRGRLKWECPETLTAARREFARQCREYLP
jgi:hypothetical protein